MSDKPKTKALKDNYDWILLGFVSALRNQDYYLFLKDVFNHMNKIQLELEPGQKTATYFLDKVTQTTMTGKIWEAIGILYERRYAPIRELPLTQLNRSAKQTLEEGSQGGAAADDALANWIGPAQDLGESVESLEPPPPNMDMFEVVELGEQAKDIANKPEEDAPDEATREELEYRRFLTALNVVYPSLPGEKLDDDLRSFARFFRSRSVGGLHEDFRLCTDALRPMCLKLASYNTKLLLELQEKNPQLLLDMREERVRAVRNLFTLASTQFISSSSSVMKDLLYDSARSERVRFLAGDGADTMDGKAGGFHGSGLTVVMGGPSGFKTGVMSSLVANHVLHRLAPRGDNPMPSPTTIWGYIGEDGIEAYSRRILTNALNRDPLLSLYNLGHFKLGEFAEKVKNPEFRAAFDTTLDTLMTECHWIKPPENSRDKVRFTVMNILAMFEAKIDAGATKPKFIVIDYLNLLKLPRDLAPASRAEELSTIAHLLDEWSQFHGIPILTAVQATATGNVQARDMRFYMQEDIHECKSIQHHCRMMISLLPFDHYEPDGTKRRWMAMYVLKNRDGEKDLIFVCDLSEPENITLTKSQYYTEVQWLTHKENILKIKAELLEKSTGVAPQPQRGNNTGYNRSQPQQQPKRATVGGFPQPQKPQPAPPTEQASTSASDSPAPPTPGSHMGEV